MKKLGLADLRGIVSDPNELAKGALVFDAGGLAHLARHGEKLYADAAGSGPAPYKVSLVMGDVVKARCSCMAARTRPFCKHAAALLVAWARAPESFVESTAPPPGSEPQRRAAVKRGATDAKALQREGIERVATLVRDLGTSGVASLGADRAPQLLSLAEWLREHRLRRLAGRVRELADLFAEAVATRSSLPALEYTELVCDLLLTVRKLEKHLGGEPLDERHVEELIGKTWRKADRRPVQGLALVEYGFATRTTSDGFVIRESRFFDVAGGGHYSEKQILPGFLARRTEPKRSYAGRVLEGAAGSIYPGYPPLRLDLESRGEEQALSPAVLERMLAVCLGGAGAALTAFQTHRRDVFAPDLCAVGVRVDTIFASGPRLRIVDGEGHALYLPGDARLEEQLAGGLRETRLRAILGDIGLDATLPTLFPRAALVEGEGLELRTFGGLFEPAPAKARRRRADEAPRWTEVARAAGAGTAAISLGEVREDLADGFLIGVASLTTRGTDPLVARLRDLGLKKPAALLASIVGQPDLAERIDDFVKLFQVLGIAEVRLAGIARVDRARLVAVPTYESVRVEDFSETLEPRQAAELRAAGKLNRYQAAVHVARHYEALPADELAGQVFPTWADGSASLFVARALAARGEPAVPIARKVLSGKTGRIARMTALRVLAALGAREEIQAYVEAERDPPLRSFARSLVDAAHREAVLAQVRDHVGLLLAAPQKDSRIAGARKLASLGSLAAAPALRAAFRHDAVRDVREAAAIALGQLGDGEIVETFVADLEARHQNEAEARIAAYGLGHMGDARGVYALLDAYAEGWKPTIVGDALVALGVPALAPLLALLEKRPEIAKRAGALAVIAEQPPGELLGLILPRLAGRETLYLKLLAGRKDCLAVVAREVLARLPDAPSKDERAAARLASKALAQGTRA